MNQEWYIPDTAIPVRQGDLLICRDLHKAEVVDICLVITADCDISKGKYGKQLACLRIITLDTYFNSIWAERKLQKVVEIETNKIREQLNKWKKKLTGEEGCFSLQAVTSWVRRVEPDSICIDLNIPEPEIKKVKTSITSFKAALLTFNDDDEEKNKLKQLVEFRSVIQGKNYNDMYKEILKTAQGEVLPEDVFLLPSLPQLDELGPAVVLLREIITVGHNNICFRTIDACSTEMYLRVGRLEPTFKYAVSQAFGALYSKIGLPEEYELRCKEVFNQLIRE